MLGGDGQNLTITTKKIESIDLPGLFVAASVSRLINVSHPCATPYRQCEGVIHDGQSPSYWQPSRAR
jgi:hypothetical protein